MTTRMQFAQLLALLDVQEITASAAGSGIDIRDYSQDAKFFVMAESVSGADRTMDIDIQDADAIGGPYANTGVSFTQITTADFNEAFNERIDRFRRFIRVNVTIAGTTPVFRVACGVFARPAQ